MKRLYRDINNKIIAGVCSGIANYFNMDKTIIRLIAAILAICSLGTMILIYLVCWLIIPADDDIIDG